MKGRLDQLTLQQLIDLTCGDSSVLLEGDERPPEAVMLKMAAAILAEYKSIAAPKQAKVELAEAEELTKLRMKEKCLRICHALCTQGRQDMAREVLLELDVSPDLIADDAQVESRCRAMLDEVRYEIERTAELAKEKEAQRGHGTPDVRKAWLAEVASVMSVLKMPIDPGTINAAIYANLVNQAAERAKALAKMPPMAGMFM